eukprot:594210-Pleurochrysis_carterae.AAC.1
MEARRVSLLGSLQSKDETQGQAGLAIQPLRICNNVFRVDTSELRNTRFSDLKGFRPISSTVDEVGTISPWSESFEMYNNLGIKNYKDVQEQFVAIPLRDPLVPIFKLSAMHAQALADAAGMQDNLMHDKTLAACTGRLKVIQDQLNALPLSAYDAPIHLR